MSDLVTELDNILMDQDADNEQLSTAWDELLKEKDTVLEAIHYHIAQHNKLIIPLYGSYCLIKKYAKLEDAELLIKEMKKGNKLWEDSKFCATVLPYTNNNSEYCHEECYK